MIGKRTRLTANHEELGAKMIPFAGYSMPLLYSSILEEHQAVRKAVGLFDVSHMGEFYISGTESEQFLQNILSNNVVQLQSMQCHYTLMCNDSGGIIDDMILYRLDETGFMLVGNAENHQKDWKWITSHVKGDVILEDKSEQTSLIALQGPMTYNVLEKIFSIDIKLRKNRICIQEFNGQKIIISATGYTGEVGVEIYCQNDVASCALWKHILRAGDEFGILPIGLGARDTLRMEMGYCLYGNDINDSTSPLDSGLDWVVKLNKEQFIGKTAMLEKSSKNTLIGLLPEGKMIPRKGFSVFINGKEIGEITSGGFSPSMKRGMAIARIPKKVVKEEKSVDIEIRKNQNSAMVVPFPIFKK